MKKQIKYFLISFIIIFLSAPLGYKTINIIYRNKNLSGEYITILNGFIHSFMLIGILIFVIGVVNVLVGKNDKL
ncbi:hypothetical protein ACFIJ5_10575 [Haloimpatiens sp. FM7330]|uniref:hypothetical protein n=1 Tax=Haloimpatiens sp. FM7330 TaxID=3298610 RepID=UPI00362B2DA5